MFTFLPFINSTLTKVDLLLLYFHGNFTSRTLLLFFNFHKLSPLKIEQDMKDLFSTSFHASCFGIRRINIFYRKVKDISDWVGHTCLPILLFCYIFHKFLHAYPSVHCCMTYLSFNAFV